MLRLGNPCQCQRSTQALKRASQAAAVCGESRTYGDNGGDGETDRKTPRSVPTHSQLERCASSNPAECEGLGILADVSRARNAGNPLKRSPCAVKAARTVITGGMERGLKGYRALSLPTCTRGVSRLVRPACPNPSNAIRIAPDGGHEIKPGGGHGRGVRASHTPKMPTSRTLLG